MTGLVRKATLLSVCGLLIGGAAMAGVPDPLQSDQPGKPAGSGAQAFINLGAGSSATSPGDVNIINAVDPAVTATYVIRDAFNNLVGNATIVITFTGCSDSRLCANQPNHPGALFNCPAKTVSAVTNASGVATFLIAGYAASGPGNPPGAGAGCATVQVDGVPFSNLTIGSFDQNGAGGVNPADLSNWLGDRQAFIASALNYRGRSDFNGSNTVDPADGSLILGRSSSPAADFSCAATCL
jgi:hypothetical protein